MLDRAALKFATLTFGQATPDTETLIIFERIGQAFGANFTRDADLFRVARRATLFGEKCFRIGLRAQGTLLPTEVLLVFARVKQRYYPSPPAAGHCRGRA